MENEHPQEKSQDPTHLPRAKKSFMTSKVTFLLAGILLLGIGLLGGYSLRGNNQTSPTPTPMQQISPTDKPITTIQPASPSVSPSGTKTPVDWLTYKNNKYGFEIMYPKTYQALDDKDSLYGWPNGVVLLYNGGQSYDIAIEAWDTQAEYEAKYNQSQGNFNIIVKKIGNKYITILSSTDEPENAGIIATFKITK